MRLSSGERLQGEKFKRVRQSEEENQENKLCLKMS